MAANIPDIVAQVYGITVADLRSKNLVKHLNEARQMAMYIMYREGFTDVEIGEAINRCRTLVVRRKFKIKGELPIYKSTREKYDQILTIIQNQKQ